MIRLNASFPTAVLANIDICQYYFSVRNRNSRLLTVHLQKTVTTTFVDAKCILENIID